MCPNYSVNKIFGDDEEDELVDYITQMSAIGFGLTPQGVRKLAYQTAIENSIKMPVNWSKDKRAGWYYLYLRRKYVSQWTDVKFYNFLRFL